MQERISREDNGCHRRNKLCMVKWNPDGTRLVSADTDVSVCVCLCVCVCVCVFSHLAYVLLNCTNVTPQGVIGVWSSDIRGRLLKRQDFNRFGQLTHAVFIDTAPDDARPDFSYFMIAGKLGVVSYANEQRCANVLSLKSPVVVRNGETLTLILTLTLTLTLTRDALGQIRDSVSNE